MVYSPHGAPRDFDAVYDELRRIGSESLHLANYQQVVPQWSGTLGNGTLEGWLIHPAPDWYQFSVKLTWGSTTSHAAADQTFQLPADLTKPAKGDWCGSAWALDGSVRHTGICVIGDTGEIIFISTEGASGNWSDALPHTWANGDVLRLSISYAIELGRA